MKMLAALRSFFRGAWAEAPSVPLPVSACCAARMRTGDVGVHYTPWGTIQTVHQNFCGACEKPCGEQWRGDEFNGNWAA